MTPNPFDGPTNVLDDLDETIQTEVIAKVIEKVPPRKYKLIWYNILLHIYLHVATVVGLYYAVTTATWSTLIFTIVLGYSSLLGITAGVHRLWAHRSYKARFPLRAFLVFIETLAYQGSVIKWARDHRVHHKYSETDADPHNAKRGFFYAHMGWLLTRKHEDVLAKGKSIDISDLYADPLLRYQHKYYYSILMPLICFVLPVGIPMYFFGESFKPAFFINVMRSCIGLHLTFLVNSAAHLYGNKPYDRFINPGENPGVSILALGEGWHNYHHTFPWDFKTSEFGYRINPTAMFIMLMAKIGLAYDLKSVAPEVIRKRVERTGDGSHELWGYGDKDLNESEVTTTHKKTR